MSQYIQFYVEYNYLFVPIKIIFDIEVHKVIDRLNEFE